METVAVSSNLEKPKRVIFRGSYVIGPDKSETSTQVANGTEHTQINEVHNLSTNFRNVLKYSE